MARRGEPTPDGPGTSAGAGGTRRPPAPAPQRRRTPTTRAIGLPFTPQLDVYHLVLSRSWPEFYAAVAALFVLFNAVFAWLYGLQPDCVANARPGSFEDLFFFSVHTSATIGYGTMAPATRYGHLLVALEALMSMLGVALITGATFARFSRPRARILFSNNLVVAPRHGVPTLMLRLANARHNNILEAQAEIGVLVVDRSPEGHELRRRIALELQRNRTPLLGVSWTLMHTIDERSPFAGGPEALASLRDREAGIVVTLTGTDETMAQPVHARHAYQLDDIVWDANFADVLTILPDGTRQIDYRNFHEVVPVEKPSAPRSEGP